MIYEKIDFFILKILCIFIEALKAEFLSSILERKVCFYYQAEKSFWNPRTSLPIGLRENSQRLKIH
jgi:hypothetical protein